MLLVGVWIGATLLAAKAAYLDERANQRPTLRGSPKPIEPIVWDRHLTRPWPGPSSRFAFHTSTNGCRVTSAFKLAMGASRAWKKSIRPSLGVGLYGLLAWAFYWSAARRFEREGQA
jgi:hypothetical protein